MALRAVYQSKKAKITAEKTLNVEVVKSVLTSLAPQLASYILVLHFVAIKYVHIMCNVWLYTHA